MVTTLNILVLLVLVVINGYSIKSLVASRKKFNEELECLEDRQISQNRHINNIRQDIDSIIFQIRELKQETPIKRLDAAEKSINNLVADLDRTVGTIDQIQEKVAEINVTLENIANELNRFRD